MSTYMHLQAKSASIKTEMRLLTYVTKDLLVPVKTNRFLMYSPATEKTHTLFLSVTLTERSTSDFLQTVFPSPFTCAPQVKNMTSRATVDLSGAPKPKKDTPRHVTHSLAPRFFSPTISRRSRRTRQSIKHQESNRLGYILANFGELDVPAKIKP